MDNTVCNGKRGEISAVLDGQPFRLVLTLGALAELETAFGEDDMVALAARFETGRLKARDCIRIIGAGLRAAGAPISDAQVAAMRADGGAKGFVEIVARLLHATFVPAGPEDHASEDASNRGPFPGTP